MTTRYTSKDLNKKLSLLRNDIRDGNVKIVMGGFKRIVMAVLGSPNVQLTAEFFNPSTIKRLEVLFDVPVEPSFGAIPTGYPTQDNYAWALTNFINRRRDPWAFKRAKETPALDADAVGTTVGG